MRTWPLLLAALLLFAGCVSDDEVNQSSDPGEAKEPTGDLAVQVTDASSTPIPGATIRVTSEGGNRSSTTSAQGQASFDALPRGNATVLAQAPDHETRERSVLISPGEVTVLKVTLEPVRNAPTIRTYEFNGFFECSATYLIVTGDCLATARAVTNETGAPLSMNATNHRFVFHFPVHPGWESIDIEQRWDDGAFTAGSMMRVNLEPTTAGEEGHSPHYARAEGSSPLSVTLVPNETHATASDPELSLAPEGAELRTRTFHLGVEETQDPAGTGFLGLGAAVQQPFTVHIEVTYA